METLICRPADRPTRRTCTRRVHVCMRTTSWGVARPGNGVYGSQVRFVNDARVVPGHLNLAWLLSFAHPTSFESSPKPRPLRSVPGITRIPPLYYGFSTVAHLLPNYHCFRPAFFNASSCRRSTFSEFEFLDAHALARELFVRRR